MKLVGMLLVGGGIVFLVLILWAIREMQSGAGLDQGNIPRLADNYDPLHSLLQTETSSSNTNREPQFQGRLPRDTDLPVNFSLQVAYRLFNQGQLDAAMDKLDSIIKDDPSLAAAYNLRGCIYCQKKLWDQARQDFTKCLELHGSDTSIKFNLFEIDFMQKNYDVARAGFASLGKDPEVGDVSSYRVFLCDLFGGHLTEATKELDEFNLAGSKPSYYYSNAAWNLYHQKPDDARSWLASAARIYSPLKNEIYASSLREQGYLPLPVANP